MRIAKNPFENVEIHFDEPSHTYTRADNGDVLISVSTLIGKYKPPFDPDGSILVRCAEKKGVTPAELNAEWEKTKVDACDRGTLFHSQVEEYIKTKKVPDGPDKDIVESFAKMKFKGKLFSEVLIYSLEDMIAGTADLIELLPNNQFNLYDFKTNKKLEKYSIWGKRMLYPISHIFDCNFNAYQLQLSLYAYLLEEKGFWVKKMEIFYVNPKTRELEVHPIKNMRNDVLKLINHYKNPRSISALFGL